ncbi:transporter substrate-binding domain-containing protein [Streptomyces sp. NPDC050315]|uniref:transporter substrate-binding domain-containing protein n=1 Tax=Streptomyces sp. NPDC050315 TaxID=3155039 RepID=UPI00343CD2B0
MTRRTRVGALAAVVALVMASGCGGDDDGGDKTPIIGQPGKTVHIATAFDQPGFNLFARHHNRGFDMDIAFYLGEELGFTPKFQDVTHAGRERELQDGSADMVIATYSITPKRQQKVDFIGPYLMTSQGFLVRRDYNGIKKEKDIGGKTLCTVEGTTPARVRMPPSTVVNEVPDYSTCVSKLQGGGVDAVFSDEALLFGYVEQQKKSKVPLKVVPNVTMGLINRYGIGIPKGHRDDCKRLLKALRKYLVEEWSSDIKAQLPALVETYSGDWENRFKPDPQDLNTYSSCRV